MGRPGAWTEDPAGPIPRVPPDIAAEAAVWVARLHGPGRNARLERECLAWQGRSAVHREAFERCTETWQEVPQVTVAHAFASAKAVPTPTDGRTGFGLRVAALAVAVGVAGLVVFLQPWQRSSNYQSGVGEQQTVLLDDGTRMSLNTDTRVRVELDSTQRSVELQGGEVLFEVAHDAHRPFVVRVGGSEVVAVGTAFVVQWTLEAAAGQALSVTLIEGRVALRPAAGAGGGRSELAPPQALQVQAGERVRLSRADGAGGPVTARVDHPSIDSVTAWKRSEVVFDDVSLVDAVAEMNRYNRTPVMLLDPQASARLRVSGQYRIGDSAGFARAVAALHGLSLQERSGRFELAPPQ